MKKKVIFLLIFLHHNSQASTALLRHQDKAHYSSACTAMAANAYSKQENQPIQTNKEHNEQGNYTANIPIIIQPYQTDRRFGCFEKIDTDSQIFSPQKEWRMWATYYEAESSSSDYIGRLYGYESRIPESRLTVFFDPQHQKSVSPNTARSIHAAYNSYYDKPYSGDIELQFSNDERWVVITMGELHQVKPLIWPHKTHMACPFESKNRYYLSPNTHYLIEEEVAGEKKIHVYSLDDIIKAYHEGYNNYDKDKLKAKFSFTPQGQKLISPHGQWWIWHTKNQMFIFDLDSGQKPYKKIGKPTQLLDKYLIYTEDKKSKVYNLIYKLEVGLLKFRLVDEESWNAISEAKKKNKCNCIIM